MVCAEQQDNHDAVALFTVQPDRTTTRAGFAPVSAWLRLKNEPAQRTTQRNTMTVLIDTVLSLLFWQKCNLKADLAALSNNVSGLEAIDVSMNMRAQGIA